MHEGKRRGHEKEIVEKEKREEFGDRY